MSGVSAADLEKFCYCPLSWKLQEAGDEDRAMAAGRERHHQMAEGLENIVARERRASMFERAVIITSLLATTMALIGLFAFASDDLLLRGRVLTILALLWILLALLVVIASARALPRWSGERGELVVGASAILAMVLALNTVPVFGVSEDHGLLAQAIALMLLIAASLALSLSQWQRDSAERERGRSNVQGRIAYIGENGSPRLLRSEEHGLSGRPDYILEIDGGLVPVEVKTGRVPRGPLFSHVIQLAAYCLLLEQEGRVTYGILRYGDVQHIVAFDENLRALLLKKVGELKEAMASGEAHRDHDRPGKCRSCSRRDLCPERLD
jgi:CRISPR-associated exonuclease Cas4